MVTGTGFELFENSMDGPRKSRKFQLNFPNPVIPINNEWPLKVLDILVTHYLLVYIFSLMFCSFKVLKEYGLHSV